MFFGRKKDNKIIPCKKSRVCIFEYGMTNRDIEGMPFPKDKKDSRACPKYGHICPAFMEEFELSEEDLNIRATIHCGSTAKEMIEKGEWELSKMDSNQRDQINYLLKRYASRQEEYPKKEFPQYYDSHR